MLLSPKPSSQVHKQSASVLLSSPLSVFKISSCLAFCVAIRRSKAHFSSSYHHPQRSCRDLKRMFPQLVGPPKKRRDKKTMEAARVQRGQGCFLISQEGSGFFRFSLAGLQNSSFLR